MGWTGGFGVRRGVLRFVSASGGCDCCWMLRMSSAKLRFDMFWKRKSEKDFSFLTVKLCQDNTLSDYILDSHKFLPPYFVL